MKTGLKIILALVVLLIVVVASIPLWIDSVAKSLVETEGTAALGVETTLDKLSLSLFGGEGKIEGLTIANPEGFFSEHFFKMQKGHAAVSLGSVTEETIVIPEIVLDGVDVRLERKGTKTNYNWIIKNLEKGEKQEPSEKGKKFVIKKIAIRNVVVKTKMEAVVIKPGVTAKIKEIVLTDIGTETKTGVVMGTVVRKLIAGLLAGIADSGVDLGKELTNSLKSGLQGLGSVGTVGVNVAGGTGKAVGDVVEGIGGLFGGKKRKEEKKEDE
ncbi:MAG: DUF748 domain-containing protein [Planctomycetota bacterium]|jgi:uncharacterized protein involved in outer membrane biogenesis